MTTKTIPFGAKSKFALGAAALAAGLVALTPAPAEAQGWGPGYGYGRPAYAPRYAYRGNGYRGHGYRVRHYNGAAVAAGIIGGIAAGALIAGAARPAYSAPAYSYGHSYGGPVYAAEPVYQQHCYWRKVRQQVDWDTVVVRRVQVCE
jgi:hypothetical protein